MASKESTETRGNTRRLVRWLVSRYYPNVKISGADHIPQTGPVLLCANHANSMIDPVLIGVAARRPVRFMAKAPLFDTPVLGPIMNALGMVPAFRGSDDPREVRRNVESLDVGAKVLVDGSAMGIFPEGKSTDSAHLEMVRSGAARMAIQAVEEGAMDLKVVPIGMTYDRKEAFRSSVLIQVGEPIDAAAILAEHDGDVRKARRALTEKLEAGLKAVVVHLDNPEWEPWLEDIQHLTASPTESTKKAAPLERRKRIADTINHFMATDQARAESVAAEIKQYREDVRSAGLRIDSPVLRRHGLKVTASLVWEFICLVVLFLPAVAGTLHHLFPFVLVRILASRFNQLGRQTMATSRMFVGVPIYLAWYAVVAYWMWGYYAQWFMWTWMIAAPFLGVIAIYYWRRAGKAAVLLWHQVRATLKRDKLLKLREEESRLRDDLKQLAQEYAEHSPPPEKIVRPFKRRRFAGFATAVLAIAVLVAGAWLIRYWLFDEPLSGNGLDVATISDRKLGSLLASDEKTVVHLMQGIADLEAEAVELQQGFSSGERAFTKQADNDDVRELLRRYMTYRKALLRILWKYQKYAEIEDEKLRMRAFLLDFTTASLLYQTSLKFVHVFGENSEAVAKLNEPEPNWGIPPGLYDTIRRNLASPQNIRMFEIAGQYYRQPDTQKMFKSHGLAGSEPYDDFHTAIADADKTIHELSDSVAERIVEVAVTDAGRLIKQVQYETQSAVSTWIGDFKIRQPRDGESLIDHEQVTKLAEVLQPGDVLLERRNWYLSNAFLPGYWPHGALYVGTADDLRERNLDKNEHVRKHWAKFTSDDDEGHERVIIEAVSEGVIFSSLEHSIGGADSVAVLRPRVSEDQKNEAIARAFSFAGRPYDFEFDFETTNMLVCTEVVYRSYGGNSGPIQFPLEEIMGRQTMPAINLVRKFNDEYDTDDAQFEFVALIRGDGDDRYIGIHDRRRRVPRNGRTLGQFILSRVRPLWPQEHWPARLGVANSHFACRTCLARTAGGTP